MRYDPFNGDSMERSWEHAARVLGLVVILVALLVVALLGWLAYWLLSVCGIEVSGLTFAAAYVVAWVATLTGLQCFGVIDLGFRPADEEDDCDE